MSKIHSILGVAVGAVIIVISLVIMAYDVKLESPYMSDIYYNSITEPSEESNQYYGGDAYTGIQQAAAQAANNMIPVFEAIEAGNKGMKELNKNIIEKANVEANNLKAMVSAFQYFIGLLVLSIGLLTIVKYIGGFFPNSSETRKGRFDNSNIAQYVQMNNVQPVEQPKDKTITIE